MAFDVEITAFSKTNLESSALEGKYLSEIAILLESFQRHSVPRVEANSNTTVVSGRERQDQCYLYHDTRCYWGVTFYSPGTDCKTPEGWNYLSVNLITLSVLFFAWTFDCAMFQFAKSAKLMKNKPIINEVMNDKAIISKYEKRIRY